MTKNDIANALCRRVPDLAKSQALHVVEELEQTLADAFAKGENVYLRGFGSFVVVKRSEKTARNISKGTVITVPAHRSVKFKLSPNLKTRLNS